MREVSLSSFGCIHSTTVQHPCHQHPEKLYTALSRANPSTARGDYDFSIVNGEINALRGKDDAQSKWPCKEISEVACESCGLVTRSTCLEYCQLQYAQKYSSAGCKGRVVHVSSPSMQEHVVLQLVLPCTPSVKAILSALTEDSNLSGKPSISSHLFRISLLILFANRDTLHVCDRFRL